MEIKIYPSIFNEAYLPHLQNYNNRYEVYYGGAGSGKSVFVAQKLVYKALTDRRKILVLRKVGRTVKNSTFQLLLDVLSDWQVLKYCKVNKTDFSIGLPNGSLFLCTGLDDSEKIKSITGLTDAWLEEATEFIQDDFNQIDLRIRDPYAKGQQIFLSFNPVSKVNWCYKLFFREDFETKEELDGMLNFRRGCTVLHTNYEHNKHLPQAYLDSLLLMKSTNPVYYQIYALGQFGSLDKLVFNNWQCAEFDRENLSGELMIGLDFGFTNDPTAMIASIVDETEKRIYVFQEFYRKGLLNDEIAEYIQSLGFSKSVIIADSAEQKSIEEIRRKGVGRIKSAVKGAGSVLQGIQKLQQYEIIIHPSCIHLREEMQNYSWKKDKGTNEYINQPIDLYNHGIDALRYSLQCVGTKLKTMDKSILGL